jgi:hypothetical protein
MTIPEATHDAMAFLRGPFEAPPQYQAICKCGWRGQLTDRKRAQSEAEWHIEREEN